MQRKHYDIRGLVKLEVALSLITEVMEEEEDVIERLRVVGYSLAAEIEARQRQVNHKEPMG
jgi:hypothetical protein